MDGLTFFSWGLVGYYLTLPEPFNMRSRLILTVVCTLPGFFLNSTLTP